MSEKLTGIYPYVPGKGGIDFPALLSPLKGNVDSVARDIKGGSGAELTLLADSFRLIVEEKVDPNAKATYGNRLSAITPPNHEPGTLCFSLRSKKVIGAIEGEEYYPIYSGDQKHPDFHAKKFIGVALAYFEARGVKINSILGSWSKGGDNYDQYIAALSGVIEPSLSQKVAAAKETWSGKAFMAYDFTNVHPWSEMVGQVEFRFRKSL